MARIIEDNLYRVSLDSERNNIYVSAKDTNDLIHFIVDAFVGHHDIYGAKRINRDGTIQTVQIVTNPLFTRLRNEKLSSGEGQNKKELLEKKTPLSERIIQAESKQQELNILSSEKEVVR